MTLFPRRPVVLLDTDGLKGDFHTAGRRVVEEVTGRPAPAELATKWNVEKCYGLTPEEEAEVVRRWGLPGFCASIEPFPEALDGVRALREIADVYPVTSPFESLPWAHEREGWLATHFGFHRDSIVSTSAKFLIKGDVFVDDKPKNVIDWQMAHPDAHGLLWHQPYNVDDSLGRLLRAKGRVVPSWLALYDFVKSLQGTLR